jgi:hypothetical protein
MRHDVFISFSGSDDIGLHTAQPMPLEDARRWLDGEFTRLGCEPTRPSGKVLFVDKVLGVAQGAGAAAFADAAWADAYTRACAGALQKTLIRVDVPNSTVGF